MRIAKYILFSMLAISMLIGAIAIIFNGQEKNASASTSTVDKALAGKKLRTLDGTQRIAARLREPESIKLESAIYMDDGWICYKFRSRNGFGGMNVNYALENPEGTILINDYDDNGPDHSAVGLWNRHCSHRQGDIMTTEN